MSYNKLLSFAVVVGISMLILTQIFTSTVLEAHDVPSVNLVLNQPIAISQYQSGYRIYAVDPESGKLQISLDLESAAITTVGVPATTTLLAHTTNPFTGHTISVYRLSSGEFKVDTPYVDDQVYSIKWDESGNLVRSVVQ